MILHHPTVLLALPLAFACGCARDPGPRAKNVIVVSIDTLRPDHLGCYGYDRETSPAIDAVAAQGTLFEDASSAAPWTLPGHASMLTGLYPASHGVRDHDRTLGEDTPSLATLLGAQGFRTYAVVNSHNIADPRYGLQQGFAEGDFVYIPEQVAVPGETTPLGTPKLAIPNRGREITRKALELLEEHRRKTPDRRFFLFLHYYDVHTDFTPDPEYRRRFVEPYDGPLTGNTQQLAGYRRRGEAITEDDARWLRQMYDAEIRQLDDVLSGFFRYLDDSGLTKDTLLIVTSDHGEEFGEHGGVLHGRSQYQELLAIPLILRGPGVPVGRRIDWPVSIVDLVPTVLRVTGVRARQTFDGVDLTRLWLTSSPPPPRYLFGEADHNVYIDGVEHADVHRMARIGREKLHFNALTGRYEFYRLDRDPFEQEPLAPAALEGPEAEALEALRAALDRLMANEGSGHAIPPPDAEERARLEQLGY